MVDLGKEHSTFLQGYDQRKRARDLPRAGGTSKGKDENLEQGKRQILRRIEWSGRGNDRYFGEHFFLRGHGV
jgi:hypothetical protein